MSIHPSWKLAAWIGVAVVAIAIIAAIVNQITEAGMGAIEEDGNEFVTYFITGALVFGDAVVAVFPGETTLNTASILASDGELELVFVIVAGFLGAWLGDNALYWIARSIPALRKQVEEAQQNEKFKEIMGHIDQNASILVVICRFLPFVRWGVVAGMGVLPMPYKKFLVSDTIGCAAWQRTPVSWLTGLGTPLPTIPSHRWLSAASVQGSSWAWDTSSGARFDIRNLI